jgi:hypothetical protein
MAYKISLLLLFLFSYSIQSYSQNMIVKVFIENKRSTSFGDTIYYDFNQSLSWKDFKGKPDNNYFGGAVTASGFAFDSQMNSDGTNIYLNIGVYTFFTKNDSWKKPDINSDYHLLHEQHHFDITKIGSEKFIDELKKANFTKGNYNKLIASIFNKVYDENEAMQQQYDKETMHSINVNKQNEWNEKIAAEIKKLKETAANL